MSTDVLDLSVSSFTAQLKQGLEDGFERVVELRNERAGLTAFIALHSTALGPALGGCRMYPYVSREAALKDVCNLARGMSYKNALAGIGFGGGKAVIVGDPGAKTPELLDAFAEGLNALKGDYLSAEDSGISPADMFLMAKRSAFVAGADKGAGGGNPAPFTARGVFLGLEAAVEARLGVSASRGSGNTSLSGLRVGVEGLGQVGYLLARMRRESGADVIASELNPARLQQAGTELGVSAVEGDALLDSGLDVFAPCSVGGAMGGAISAKRVNRVRAPVIAGAANNQLENAALGDLLARRRQLYAPDYVINAAGVISIAGEYLGCWSPEWVGARVEQIPYSLGKIFEQAEQASLPTSLVADRCAREAIRSAQSAALPISA